MAVPKTPWVERICHLCENMNIENENHFLLKCLVYTNIRSQFHNLCWNTTLKKIIKITKIRTNSHELHSETGCWTVPKTPWMERICRFCENMNIEDENHFLLEYPTYTHIRSQFHNLCCNSDLPSLLTYQNYSEVGTLLSKLFEHRNTILKQIK